MFLYHVCHHSAIGSTFSQCNEWVLSILSGLYLYISRMLWPLSFDFVTSKSASSPYWVHVTQIWCLSSKGFSRYFIVFLTLNDLKLDLLSSMYWPISFIKHYTHVSKLSYTQVHVLTRTFCENGDAMNIINLL